MGNHGERERTAAGCVVPTVPKQRERRMLGLTQRFFFIILSGTLAHGMNGAAQIQGWSY